MTKITDSWNSRGTAAIDENSIRAPFLSSVNDDLSLVPSKFELNENLIMNRRPTRLSFELLGRTRENKII